MPNDRDEAIQKTLDEWAAKEHDAELWRALMEHSEAAKFRIYAESVLRSKKDLTQSM